MSTAEKLPSAPVPEARTEDRVDLPEQWLELATVSQRTAVETVRKLLETVEVVPVVGTSLSITERLAHAEYDALRSMLRSAVDVGVNVNVDVLSKGLHVDVLSRGVNVNVLSRAATP